MKRVVHILLIISFFLSVTYSQDLLERTLNGSLQKAELKANDKVASIFDVSKTLKSSEYSDYIEQAVFLDINAKELSRVVKSDDSQIIMEIPVSVGKSFNLILHEVDILAPGYYAETSDGRIIYPDRSKIKFYRGKVENDQYSVASITIINDQIRGVISDKNGDYNLGLFENQKSLYTLFNDKKLKSTNSFTCGTDDERHDINPNRLLSHTPRQKNNISPCVPIYVEADYETYLDYGAQTEAYVMSLIAEVAMIYNINTGVQNDPKSIAISLAKTFIWTTSDPYSSNNSTDIILDQFGKRLYDGDSTPGDGRLCHLISTRPILSGIAWIDVLCSDFVQWCWYDCNGGIRNGAAPCGFNFTNCSQRAPIDYAYVGPAAVSYGLGNVTPFPTYSWTVEVFAHEMGHNMGSPHTHACAWNNNNTAIDGCGPAAGYNEGCNVTPLPASGEGTIMSYCHLLGNVGIDLANGFGVQPGNRIYDNYSPSSCTLECASPDIDGCTDPMAHNYNENATVDDGSCETCSDNIQNGDEEGVDCGGLNPNCQDCISGCTDIAACNYDPSANVNMGCEYLSCAGCTNAGACNYDNSATIDDGSCEYTSCAGCTEVFASNYDPTKTINNGTCIYDCDASSTEDITNSNANSTIISGANTMSTNDMSPVDVDMVGPYYWRARQSIELNGGFTIQAGASLTIDVGDCDN